MLLPSRWVGGILLILISGSSSKSIFNVENLLSKTSCNLPQETVENIAGYQNATNVIIDYITNGAYRGKTWSELATFVDKFGPRLSGSQVLEDSIDYMIKHSRDHGLENIYTENVTVPHWLRGKESATLLKPRVANLPMLGLGYSVSTPPEGITAHAVVVKSFEELRALDDSKVHGKIVVYDQDFISYPETVIYRTTGASEAAKKGAVASLIKSIAPFTMSIPHTGAQFYESNVTKIPTAAITHEDADFLSRLQKRGEEIIIKIIMPSTIDTKISRNTMAELTGSSEPDKIVIVSGHIDSWDVGVGALDDGGGLFISWVAPVVLKSLNLRPRRTIRLHMWTAEELGLIGGKAFTDRHESELNKINFAMESDFGTFKPLGIVYQGGNEGECMMKEILKLFKSINATTLHLDEAGPDLKYMLQKGVPGGGLLNQDDKYFWYHHSAADRMNVLKPEDLDLCAAFWTAFSYIVADMQSDIPRS